MRMPKANSPDLWKYPKLLAEIIYPDMTVDEIVEHCVKFAEQEWELEEYIPLIDCVVPQALADEIAVPPNVEKLGMDYWSFDPLSAILEEVQNFNDDSLFFCMIEAVYYVPDDSSRMSSYFGNLRGFVGYSANPESPEVLPLLFEATRDFVLAYGWREYLSAAYAHQAICEAMNCWPQTEEFFAVKIRDYISKGVCDDIFLVDFPVFVVSVEARIRKEKSSNDNLKELIRQVYDWLGQLAQQDKDMSRDTLELIYERRLWQWEYINADILMKLEKCRKWHEQFAGTEGLNRAKKRCDEIEAQFLPYPQKP